MQSGTGRAPASARGTSQAPEKLTGRPPARACQATARGAPARCTASTEAARAGYQRASSATRTVPGGTARRSRSQADRGRSTSPARRIAAVQPASPLTTSRCASPTSAQWRSKSRSAGPCHHHRPSPPPTRNRPPRVGSTCAGVSKVRGSARPRGATSPLVSGQA